MNDKKNKMNKNDFGIEMDTFNNFFSLNSYKEITIFFDKNEFDFKTIESYKIKTYKNNDRIETDFIMRNKSLVETLFDFIPIKTSPDLNCLFNAVSIILNDNEDLSSILKIGATQKIIKNQKYFKDFFERRKDEFETTFEKCVERVAKNYTLQGAFAITSIAMLISRPIWIFSENNYKGIEYANEYIPLDRSPLIIYNSNMHFTAMKPKFSLAKYPPRPTFKLFPKKIDFKIFFKNKK